MLEIKNLCRNQGLMAGIIIAQGVQVQPAPPELKSELEALVCKRQKEDFPPLPLKAAVRDMLRTAAYKPTGRGKPASEYLAQAAKEGRFPFINNLVDINNYISLLSGFPATLLDLEAIGDEMLLRQGEAGEKYVFNQAGQEIDVHGLVCVCGGKQADKRPLGNPVKDSMEAKVKGSTSSVVGVIYAPQERRAELEQLTVKFGEMLIRYAATQQVETHLV